MRVETLRWNEERGQIEMIDQRVLPARFDMLGYDSAAEVAAAPGAEAGSPMHTRSGGGLGGSVGVVWRTGSN